MTSFVDAFMSRYLHQGIWEDPVKAVQVWVDRWNRNPKGKGSLREYLGLTEEEFEVFLKNPSSLRTVLSSYGEGGDLCCDFH